MKSSMNIKYNWICDKVQKQCPSCGHSEEIKIPKKHLEALKEFAKLRIFEMLKQGYSEGELHTSIKFGLSGEDLTYSGRWSINENGNL